jgi:acyl-CoA thioesterase FadM
MNLYLRLVWIWLHARFKPRIRMGDTIEMRLRVLPNDIDVNGHMNNGRYMTIIDLALIEYFTRLGFLKPLKPMPRSASTRDRQILQRRSQLGSRPIG